MNAVVKNANLRAFGLDFRVKKKCINNNKKNGGTAILERIMEDI